MNPIRFTIIGDAEPQGSAKIVPLRRTFPFTIGSFRDLLRSVAITSDNAKLKAWRKTVAHAARLSFGGVAMELTGGVGVEATFHVATPQHVPADRGGLPIVRPDLDKLARGLLDGLTGVVWHDDEQVVDLVVRKRYAPVGSSPRVDVTITPITLGLPLFSDERIAHADTRHDSVRRRPRPAAADTVPW
jgi:crossover junction endodeoxyribonuclease RusA